MDAIESYYGSSSALGFTVEDIYFIDDPSLVKTLATYVWSKDV